MEALPFDWSNILETRRQAQLIEGYLATGTVTLQRFIAAAFKLLSSALITRHAGIPSGSMSAPAIRISVTSDQGRLSYSTSSMARSSLTKQAPVDFLLEWSFVLNRAGLACEPVSALQQASYAYSSLALVVSDLIFNPSELAIHLVVQSRLEGK